LPMGLIYDAKQIALRDPAARSVAGVVLLYPGFHALVYYKISHFFYGLKWLGLARWISERGKHHTGVEIHPGARIGKGLFIDHGAGIVIGETSIIGDNCTIYHGVTLGGRGHAKHTKRHPTIGDNVLIGSGAKLLGNITIGDNANIGANAVILHDVPAGATVVGVPGKIVRIDGLRPTSHAIELDHTDVEDPLECEIRELCSGMIALQEQVRRLEDELGRVSRAGTEKQTATVCPGEMNDCDGSGSDDISGNAGTNDTI